MPTLTNKSAKFRCFRLRTNSEQKDNLSTRIRLVPLEPKEVSAADFKVIKELKSFKMAQEKGHIVVTEAAKKAPKKVEKKDDTPSDSITQK